MTLVLLPTFVAAHKHVSIPDHYHPMKPLILPINVRKFVSFHFVQTRKHRQSLTVITCVLAYNQQFSIYLKRQSLHYLIVCRLFPTNLAFFVLDSNYH